jgi:excisionase family DNA binding protein
MRDSKTPVSLDRLEAPPTRRTLQAMWQDQPASGASATAPPIAQPAPAAADLVLERLAAVESALARIEKGMKASQATSPDRQLYTVSEVAELTKLSEWTVRNACNKGRIKAQKGPNGQWRVARDELVKIQNEGLPK